MLADPPGSTLDTTERSLALLEAIKRREGATMTELAEELSLAVSTVFKHLATLESNGYLIKEEDTYHVGFRFLNLGEHARSRLPGNQAIDEAVHRLAEETTEEVDFIVEDHGRIITVSESYHKWVKYAEGGSNGYRARMGTYYPIHSTASGKAILATYSRERVDSIVDRWGLEAVTENTITDREQLYEELNRTEERGFALGDEEYTEGLRSVGMAVRDGDGNTVGSMSVSGPSYRLTGDVFRERIPASLRTVVEKLEAEIAAATAGD
ncbi:DNA-binding transcriptional regulator, IclR family [Halalkaliarchaeum sp. AArc-CO]|uniref:IclR family transcriptional regulator n=1 Tax=unclassified Halalkaliarchaeum TaxID=2678344 RepID=UPI00217EFBFA|nr:MULTISPECIES: IclR family transcriptional regulator [unclassified Halalkaliarchaeum]MDR5672195.1 IclR family transcriptional regulator [Halalkaliarchaeum sp. AArc-GB]UWG51701.1 DNA-binding transcriptional regulator, IclR family [Halalkaliarchaeum sp. AArc-CO]